MKDIRIEEFSKDLNEEMELQLEAENNTPKEARVLYFIVLKAITKLREFFINYSFEDKKEEVNFFKAIKPKFLSKLIYYRKIFEIGSAITGAMTADITPFYIGELAIAKRYIDDNREFFNYYRSESSLLDEIYFVRLEPDLWLSLNAEDCGTDDFATVYDHKLSKLLAYEKVSAFLIESINTLSGNEIKVNAPSSVTWTASKAALIELLYAVQTSGACNGGTIDVKELAHHFENLFNVKLGNFYRTFQEIRIRKMSRTAFLDQLKENLVKRMDNSDENPRF